MSEREDPRHRSSAKAVTRIRERVDGDVVVG